MSFTSHLYNNDQNSLLFSTHPMQTNSGGPKYKGLGLKEVFKESQVLIIYMYFFFTFAPFHGSSFTLIFLHLPLSIILLLHYGRQAAFSPNAKSKLWLRQWPLKHVLRPLPILGPLSSQHAQHRTRIPDHQILDDKSHHSVGSG